MPRVFLTKFNKSMTADGRDPAGCQLCKHFDNFTKSHALVPYKSSSAVTVSPVQTTSKIERMLMYNSISTLSTNMYGLGQTSGGFVQILSSSNLSVPSFAIVASGAGSVKAVSYDMFVEYKGIAYGGNGGTHIWSYNIGTPAFNETLFALTYTSLSNAVKHSKDDILYFGVNDSASPSAKIYYKNGTNNIALALTLPSNLVISSISEFGNYLAIACRPLYQDTINSKVFLWDRDVTLSTVSETIDWGNSDLYAIENIDGYLIGVSIKSATTQQNKLIFSKYSGGGAIKFDEIALSTYYQTPGSLNYVIRGQQKFNNRLYFGLSATSLDAVTNDFTGIWSVGRSNESAPFAVAMDRTPNDDTVALRINGFLLVNDYCYISYLSDATTWAFSFTIFANTFNTTSKYRESINPGMPDIHKPLQKQLTGIGITYDGAIAAGTQCAVKYRVDGGSFTTIVTETSATQFTEMGDASGTEFTAGRDYEFQFESKGVTITGFYYDYDIIPT